MTYEYICDNCNAVFDVISNWDEYKDRYSCPNCSYMAKRVYSIPTVFNDIEPYFDRGLGCRIESRADMKAKMIGLGVREVGNELVDKHEEILKKYYAEKHPKSRPPKINR